MYQDGWIASTVPTNPPWELTKPNNPDVINAYKWELYDISHDWTQDENLAEKHPEKLRELQQLFLVEAAKYQVFPLDSS